MSSNPVERGLEQTLFASRWLMAPMYLGLVVALAMLVIVFLREVAYYAPQALALTVDQAILAALTLIDLTLAANLLLIVLFSGYESFVSKLDIGETADRPAWMGTVDFGGMKLKLIASIVAECFPADLVTVINGDKEVATALLELPFDHIFFTGSPAVGSIVMAAAAKNLSSVSLELGGKSPAVIGPGADLKQAADWVTFGKFTNAGQTCIAPDHLFVHDSIRDEFVAILRARISRAYGEGGKSPFLARIVNAGHATRLRGLLSDASAKGARTIMGEAGQGNDMPPTLIEAITPEMQIDHQEIFGPILPIFSFCDPDAVIARINSRPKPLSLYIFERNRGFADHIIESTSSGSVGINLTMLQFSHGGLPFGGVNHSGMGAAHGEFGFRAFSHQRAILSNRFSALPVLFAPYGRRVKWLVGVVKRLLG